MNLINMILLLIMAAVFVCEGKPQKKNNHHYNVEELSDSDLQQLAESYIYQFADADVADTQSYGSSKPDILQMQSHNNPDTHVVHDVGWLDLPWHGFPCKICKLGMWTIQKAFLFGISDEKIVSILTSLCINMRVESKRICTSIIPLFQDEVLSVFGKVALAPAEVCAIVVGHGCGNRHYPNAMWNITLPDTPKPPVTPPQPPSPSSPTVRILQLSDIHVDLDYKAGSNANCGEPLCCRADDGVPHGEPAWTWGDYRNCDLPPWTLENLFQHLCDNETFDYIYWTGDLPAHNVWNQSRSDQLYILSYLSNMLQKYFPNSIILPALGNHESSPVNSFPPAYVKGRNSISWLYDALEVNWLRFLPQNGSYQHLNSGAYYTVLLRPGFRVISLNTNYCNDKNWWLYINATDPDGSLSWLISVLQKAEDLGEKVHIIGHIPTGISDCLKPWSWNYYKIVNRYESTITGQFFGHTHRDHFEVFYDEETLTRPVGVSYISPSVTPYEHLNPGYRVYTVDGFYKNSTWSVLDHETHIMNISEAQITNKPRWYKEYSAKSAYNMTSLFPQDWDQLIGKLETNRELFNTYYSYLFKSYSDGLPCDEVCHREIICGLRSARSGDVHFCKNFPEEQHTAKPRPHNKKLC